MGSCSSVNTKDSDEEATPDPESQRYHGAMAPVQFSLGVDKLLENWIRKSGFNIYQIPTDIFRFVLNYTSFFDDFEFQQNIYWDTWQADNNAYRLSRNESRSVTDETQDFLKKARKKNGMGCHHNILFGSILTGDIEYKCKIRTSSWGWSQKAVAQFGIGLVEPGYYDYLERNMHTGKDQRCVFNNKEYYDCDGKRYEYAPNFNFEHSSSNGSLLLCVNMKEHTFTIIDHQGNKMMINDIPDNRVICFEMYPCTDLNISDQSLQWVW